TLLMESTDFQRVMARCMAYMPDLAKVTDARAPPSFIHLPFICYYNDYRIDRFRDQARRSGPADAANPPAYRESSISTIDELLAGLQHARGIGASHRLFETLFQRALDPAHALLGGRRGRNSAVGASFLNGKVGHHHCAA